MDDDLDFNNLDGGKPGAKTFSIPKDIPENEGGRRLPLYLLIDRSESMQGTPITAVNRGLNKLKNELAKMGDLASNVYIGLVVFSGQARLMTGGLVPLAEFSAPELNAAGLTNLGDALRVLNQSIEQDVIQGVTGGKPKGDWKPVVFLLTDGKPDDGWQEPMRQLMNRPNRKVAFFVAVGCGNGVKEQDLIDIVGPSGKYARMDASDFAFEAFFAWVTQTVASVSGTVNIKGQSQEDARMPIPNQVIQYVDQGL